MFIFHLNAIIFLSFEAAIALAFPELIKCMKKYHLSKIDIIFNFYLMFYFFRTEE